VQGDAITQSARTGLGLSADGRQLLLLTLDRRIDFSAPGGLVGATAWEVGAVLQGFGAWDGLNLDGGSSTQMAWWNQAAGQAQLLNAPLLERYVGQSLGVGYW
jgi:exopolysaccharide biosynthesis protein